MTAVIYRARDGWRWRLVARNNRIVADSGEAYTRARDAQRALDRLLAAPIAAVITKDPT